MLLEMRVVDECVRVVREIVVRGLGGCAEFATGWTLVWLEDGVGLVLRHLGGDATTGAVDSDVLLFAIFVRVLRAGGIAEHVGDVRDVLRYGIGDLR
jgi:hypothetical protein